MIGVVREIARIGHHARIDTRGHLERQRTETQLGKKEIDQLARRRAFGERHDDIRKVRRVEMVVDQDLRTRRRHHPFAHNADPLRLVEIGTQNKVRRRNALVAHLGCALVDENPVRSGHPTQKSGESRRDNDRDIRLADGTEIVEQAQAAAHGVAIGRSVGENDYMLGGGNQAARRLDLLRSQFGRYHIVTYC